MLTRGWNEMAGCSSIDNPAEVPENTLTRSSCEVEVDFLSRSILAQQPLIYQEWAQRIQLKCGCARGRPCYWSTYEPDMYMHAKPCLINVCVLLVPSFLQLCIVEAQWPRRLYRVQDEPKLLNKQRAGIALPRVLVPRKPNVLAATTLVHLPRACCW